MAKNGYDLELATTCLNEGKGDLFTFDRLFTGNPDLVGRLRTGAPLNAFDPATLYGGGTKGYIDCPTPAGASSRG